MSQNTEATRQQDQGQNTIDPSSLLGWMPRRVVIVDDERAVLFALERAFRDAGVKEVLTFEDGNSASKFIASGASVDAFVLDWRLPDLGGLALLNRIRAQSGFDRTPVVIVSGFLEKRDFRLAAEFPLLTLVEKPSHANYLFKKLGELFRERDFFDAEGERLASEIGALEPRGNVVDDRWEKIRSRLRDAPRPAPVFFIAINLLRKKGLDALADGLLQDLLGLEPIGSLLLRLRIHCFYQQLRRVKSQNMFGLIRMISVCFGGMFAGGLLSGLFFVNRIKSDVSARAEAPTDDASIVLPVSSRPPKLLSRRYLYG